MEFSIIIPVYNEHESLAALGDEILRTIDAHGWTAELIFVDDGSRDGSWSEIQRWAEKDPRVRGIGFRRNYGKSAALAAGLHEAQHPWIVTIDADLQDNFTELPKLIARARDGLDLVTGWKIVRRDPWTRRLPSRAFNWLVNRLSGLRLHDHNCGFKLFRRDVLSDVPLSGEWHRFIPLLAAAGGWTVGEVAVDHRPRRHGRSKYGWGRLVTASLDLITIGMLTSYNHRPQHALGVLGLISAAGGGLGLLYLTGYWLVRMVGNTDWAPLHERPLLAYSIAALLLGVHLLALAFLAALVSARPGARSRPSLARRTEPIPNPAAAEEPRR